MSMDFPVNRAEATLRGSRTAWGFENDDEMFAALGYEGELMGVFRGRVGIVEADVTTVRVVGVGSTWRLVNQKVNRLYEKQTAGAIVSDLAASADVYTAEVQEGLSFPSYVVDDAKNTYEHIAELASRCGFHVFCTAEDKLTFKRYDGKEIHVLEFGSDITSIEGRRFGTDYTSVKILGESPSSTKGSDTWHWITKEAVVGAAGSGKALVMADPTVKDRDTAEKVAKARLEAIQRRLWLKVGTVGKPEIRLGEAVELRGMPEPGLNGEYEVRRVEHTLSKVEGFKTAITCRRA